MTLPRASYRIARQVEGRGSFADVSVGDSAELDPSQLTGTPPAWLAAAERGIHAALAAMGLRAPQVALLRVIYTHVDTDEDTVHAAAFMATARSFAREQQFRLVRHDGRWCVVPVEPA